MAPRGVRKATFKKFDELAPQIDFIELVADITIIITLYESSLWLLISVGFEAPMQVIK